MTFRDGNSWSQPSPGDFINSIRSHNSVLQCWCINLDLPQIILMSGGFWQRHRASERHMSFQRPRVWMRMKEECEGETDRESKQRQNHNKNEARPEKENERQKASVGLCSWSVPPQQLSPGPCLSSFDGLSTLSLHLPGGQVFIGRVQSLAERLHTDCVDWETGHCLRIHDGGLSKFTADKSTKSSFFSDWIVDLCNFFPYDLSKSSNMLRTCCHWDTSMRC